MPHFDWYAVQVMSGQERKMIQFIETACAEDDEESADLQEPLVLDECFAPRYRTQKKMYGEWRNVERALMPGYLIAAVNDPVQLAQRLRRVNDFCRVVKSGQTYVPLNAYERTWLEAHTSRGDRVVPMSFGRKVGDTLEVTQGPLKGYEGRITKVKRSDSLALLEFHVGSIRIKTTVGLGILPE
ncbi:transcription termination/antitermination NusG family protein [Adlercreutzia sp. ZJ304]|uniref:transcription termination/antitermination NusG family protein n=1 Tax=Adlercreutzia sp. ZJ304 TaxID=2709791 RepID=UPI0013EA5446|nr:transcription termination/antitermination NusG family protein [Adlercreutzia sp. ZJ304]